MYDHDRASSHRFTDDAPAGKAPGKVTLTGSLPVQRKATAAATTAAPPAASTAEPSAPGADPFWFCDAPEIHAAAARGVDTPATALPHADRIAASFGRHAIDGISAHTGAGAAAAAGDMGARAFATGNHVVLGDTSLHTVAHEAAHAVQQRAGVHLAGGIGGVDDLYERHADAVADAVVRGESAEALLDQHAGSGSGSGGAPAIQGKFLLTDAQRARAGLPHGSGLDMVYADDGNLAVKDPDGDPKFFYAEANLVTAADAQLAAQGGTVALRSTGANLAATDIGGNATNLVKVEAYQRANPLNHGDTFTAPERCNEMAEAVIGSGAKKLREDGSVGFGQVNEATMAMDLAKFIEGYHYAGATPDGPAAAGRLNRDLPRPPAQPRQVTTTAVIFHCRSDANRTLVSQEVGAFNLQLMQLANNGASHFQQAPRPNTPGDFPLEVVVWNDAADLAPLVMHIIANRHADASSQEQVTRPHGLDTTAREHNEQQTVANVEAIGGGDRNDIHNELGFNEWASPDVGDAYTIVPLLGMGDPRAAGGGFPYHWGGVVARSGNDNVTLENFWQGGGNDDANFFSIYGPWTRVDVDAGGDIEEQATTPGQRANGTFHRTWRGAFAGKNPLTIVTRRANRANTANHSLPDAAFDEIDDPSSSSDSDTTSSSSSDTD